MAAPVVHPRFRGAAAVSLLLLAAAALWLIFRDGLTYMVLDWGQEEYSYAYLIPPIAAWLIWQRRARLVQAGAAPSWWGAPLVLAGIVLAIFGDLATLYVVIQYAFIIAIFGVALTLVGWRGLAILAAPLFYLFFMVPLPDFLYQGLSAQLQLISSALGVAFIRLFGLPVFLEGNIIDLGVYQLQVAEACSGLRYLFPLLSFGYLCALLYKGPWWHKVVLLLSTLPITILVNSVRIGLVGVLVNFGGIEQAEGFMHLFEGWIIFLAAVAILFGEMWLLARLSGRRGRLADLLDLDEIWPKRADLPALALPGAAQPVLLSAFVLMVGAAGALALPARPEIVPPARNLALFSLALDDWHGVPIALERLYIEALRFDDYVLADFNRADGKAPVNFYLAYYGSQRKGASVHSPRTCIPGGGWEVADISRMVVNTSPAGISTAAGRELGVNRVIIARGAEKQLVYYWFDQRGRQMTNEYVVKLMLAWDALTRRRTDGALVRMVTPVRPGEDLTAADQRLQDFIRAAYPEVRAFVPA